MPYLFIGVLSLKPRVLHELVVLLAVNILIELFRSDNDDFIGKSPQILTIFLLHFLLIA